jgi:Na+(H+)/acetate symporter ActP
MQFLILLIGVLVFAFYQFNAEPVFFNQSQITRLAGSKYKDSLVSLRRDYDAMQTGKVRAMGWMAANADQKGSDAYKEAENRMESAEAQKIQSRATLKRWLNDKEVAGNSNDTNYIFLRFVMDNLPRGLIGLLIAVIFLAAWGSIAAALNSLASCTIVDFHKRLSKQTLSDEKEYRLSKAYTVIWGIFCMLVAQLAYNIGNSLIEAVNVLGSLFYGVILGIFLVAFYLKNVGGRAVFISALIVEAMVITIHVLDQKGILHLSFLWLNVVGAVGVLVLSAAIQGMGGGKAKVVADGL